jgi:two-component system, cell cycle sensor histidine kinase and response regulator CckA
MNLSLDGEREMSGANCDLTEASGNAGTILYVEDEAFVREVTAEVLRAAGYQVLVARNGAEAADIFQGWGLEVDLLLTDVILPGETGRSLAARLRRKNPRLRVLYVTGYADQMAMQLSPKEGCLAKPFSTDTLLARVSRMIERRDYRSFTESESMLACAGA